MNFCTLLSFLALFQASASAVTWSSTCNADNCLRGLFGANVKTVAANIAACSASLPAITVVVDGIVSTTMTATVAPPAVASVCDGQGVDKRAARFKSACSCIGITPNTVTQIVSATAMETASASEVTLGSLANMVNAGYCGLGSEILQVRRTSSGPSYTVPRAGQIVSATTFDGLSGSVVFEVWRPSIGTDTEPIQYTLVGESERLVLTGSGTTSSFTLPQPIAVEVDDVLGLYFENGLCAAFSGTFGDTFGYALQERVRTSVGTQKSFGTSSGTLLNVAAVLRFA